jgi:hypothetical protein
MPGGVVEQWAHKVLLDGQLGEARCDIQLVQDGSITPQLDEIQNDMLSKRLEYTLLLATNLEPYLVESLAKRDPFW